MLKPQIILCDIEGCVTANKLLPICTEVLVKISAYCEIARKGMGIPLVLCTGRPQPYAEAIIQILGAFFPNFPSIVENGCHLYDPVKDILIANPAIVGKQAELKEVAMLIDEKFIQTGVAKKEPGKEICLSLNPIGELSVSQLFDEVMVVLPQALKNLVFVTHSSSAVDITPCGVSKGTALAFLSQRIGILPAEMIGIGDTRGDFPMLEKVGYPACPANASQEVKELVVSRGGFVAPSPNASGVWDILMHHNLVE